MNIKKSYVCWQLCLSFPVCGKRQAVLPVARTPVGRRPTVGQTITLHETQCTPAGTRPHFTGIFTLKQNLGPPLRVLTRSACPDVSAPDWILWTSNWTQMFYSCCLPLRVNNIQCLSIHSSNKTSRHPNILSPIHWVRAGGEGELSSSYSPCHVSVDKMFTYNFLVCGLPIISVTDVPPFHVTSLSTTSVFVPCTYLPPKFPLPGLSPAYIKVYSGLWRHF